MRSGRSLAALFSVLLGTALCCAGRLRAQATEGVLSEKEVDTLRDTAYEPMARIVAYVKILDDRQRWIDELVHGQHHLTTAEDLHDAMDQFGQIADELNDNLDQYGQRHRDIRKTLPKLVEATERWSTSLRSAAENEHYNVVRKIALDALKDTRQIADQMRTEQEAYFKAHPEAEKAEKARRGDPHAPMAGNEH
jgi:methyl-accepting chemotaxis protein